MTKTELKKRELQEQRRLKTYNRRTRKLFDRDHMIPRATILRLLKDICLDLAPGSGFSLAKDMVDVFRCLLEQHMVTTLRSAKIIAYMCNKKTVTPAMIKMARAVGTEFASSGFV